MILLGMILHGEIQMQPHPMESGMEEELDLSIQDLIQAAVLIPELEVILAYI